MTPFVAHLHTVAHNPTMAELLECRDSGYAVLEKNAGYNGPAAALVREKLRALDAAYAKLSDALREEV